MATFNNRIFGSNVDSEIRKKFKSLEKGSVEIEDELGSVQEVNYQDYLGDRTTFARMWAPLLISGSDRQDVIFHTVNDARGNDYEEALEPISTQNYVNELQDNYYLRNPKAGITSVTTKTQGSLGAVKSVTIEFTVFNKTDFDTIYQPYFLKPNATIVVDFGWGRDAYDSLYNIRDIIELDDVHLEKFDKFIYGQGSNFQGLVPTTQRDGWINKEENIGVVDVLIGRVIDFSAKYSNEERYECSVTISSKNASLLDKAITEENDLKFLFTNKFEEVLIELLSSPAEEKGINNTSFIASDQLSVEEKQQVFASFYNELGLSSNNLGVLSEKNINNGIFYQSVEDVYSSNANKLSSGYISYGLFEDLFLNVLIAENNKDDIHQVQFNSKDSLVRYSDNLVNRQREYLSNNEDLSVILYPEDSEYLKDSYHAQTAYREIPEDWSGNFEDYRVSLYENWLSGKDKTYNTKVIPLRDLFVSIKTITKAFESKQNVNDAIISILDDINSDTYDILKLKLVSMDGSYSAVSVVDLNLHPPYGNETLSFDVTEDSVVSNLDLNFMMPKGGMASMIAIGENTDVNNRFSDDEKEDSLRFLEMFGPDKEAFGSNDEDNPVWVSPLPLSRDKDIKADEVKRYDYKQEKASKIIQNLDINTDRDFKTFWTNKVNQIKNQRNQKQKTEAADKAKLRKFSRKRSSLIAEDKRLLATSERDYYGKLAKQEVFGNDETSPGALIRGELSVTTIGNTYLNIGDYITINYLPKHISDKLIYIISNIEQKLGDSWETTYTTIAILKPEHKVEFTGKIEKCIFHNDVLETYLNQSNQKNSMIDRASVGIDLGTEKVHLKTRWVTCKKIKSRFTQEVFDEVEELGKSNETIKKVGASFIVNEFKSAGSSWELKFVTGLQEVILKYLYGNDLTYNPAGSAKRTNFRCFRNTPDYDNIESLYDVQEELTDKPSQIFLVGLVEDANDEYDAANNNINAAGQYVQNALKSDEVIAARNFAILEYLAKRKYGKQFFDNFVNPPTPPGFKPVKGGGDVATRIVPDLNELDVSKGMILSSFGFQLSVNVQSETDDPIETYLFDFKGVGGKVNQIVMLPKWFFDDNKITPDDFVNEISEFMTGESGKKIDEIIAEDFSRSVGEFTTKEIKTAKKNLVKSAKWTWKAGKKLLDKVF